MVGMNNLNLIYLSLGLEALLLLLIIWQAFRINKLNQIRKHFYSQGLKKNLEQIVIEQEQSIKKLNENLDLLAGKHANLENLNKNNLQKVGFVRFSPFGEAGNLSFALAVLDAHDNGIIISSFHGREGTRIYSKDIHSGKSKGKLTEEEKQALEEALMKSEA